MLCCLSPKVRQIRFGCHLPFRRGVSKILRDVLEQKTIATEHCGNSGTRSMSSNGSSCVFFWHTCTFTKHRNERVIDK